MARERPRVLAGLLWATAAAAAAAMPVLAADPPNFHIAASGPVTFMPEGPPCNGFRILGTAAARGTHVGARATLSTNECAQPDFSTGVNHIEGHAVVSATNGDEIFIHYVGDSPAPDLVTGAFHDDLEFSITGGSGHFDGVTGRGRLTANGNIYEAVVTAQLDGSIEVRPH